MSTRAPALDAAAPARPPLPVVLWRFSRPHTLVGTWVSILGIYVIAASELDALALGGGTGDLALTLLAGAAVNVYIVGLNQVEDVEIDRVNKPWLPIAAGQLSLRAARATVAGCAVVAVGLALTQGWVEVLAVTAAMAIGTAYSSPPLRLKRRPAIAAASISSVRSLAVNLGVYLHFADSLGGRGEVSAIPPSVVALTVFVVPFSIAIALLKDVPDIDGDRRYAIATFSVRLGPERVLRIGMAALTAAYLAMAVLGPLLVDDAQPVVLAAGHLAALALLWRWARATDPADPARFTRFYMRVWLLLFAEYALVAAAVLAA
jgi:homogentisate phytyltransferase / homogentisate geranylgeranyltransferase